MNVSAPRVVKLHGQFGVIIKVKSDVVYSNQAAGYACEHPTAEGVFVSLPTSLAAQATSQLRQCLQWSPRGLDAGGAGFVDEVLRKSGLGYIEVDRNKLSWSFEAWVHVLIKEPEKSLARLTRNLEPEQQIYIEDALSRNGVCEGILVWENSD